MPNFEHYMYVAECADGTLYTGYAVDPAARVAKHNTGKGAKYTRSRLPVSLLAQARFYTKHQAMSAEAHFKKLDRDRKDALLALAAGEPFEVVLAREVPALAQEPVAEYIARELAAQVDEGYKVFMVPLMPSVDPDRVAGVRTPALKKLAKAVSRRPDCKDFLKAVPHELFEEDQLHAFIAGSVKDYDQALAAIEAFLPFVDNWATCDQLPTKVLAKDPERTLEHVRSWIASEHVYTARFGIGVLMRHFLDDSFEPEFLALVASKHVEGCENPEPASDAYYLDMMRAWFFAEAMAKQPQAALPALERCDPQAVLDEWTRRKAIQKAVESYRVTPELKTRLKAARKL